MFANDFDFMFDWYTEDQAKAASLGALTEIDTDARWEELVAMWREALEAAGYKPTTRDYGWNDRVRADLDRYFGFGRCEMAAKASARLLDTAIAGGIEDKLEAYFAA